MRVTSILAVVGCVVALPVLADRSRDDAAKSKADDKNIQVATAVFDGASKERQSTVLGEKKAESEKAGEFTDNVQGLAPSDRRYRVTD